MHRGFAATTQKVSRKKQAFGSPESPPVLASLFHPTPQDWGLRGEAALWGELARDLAETVCPANIEDLQRLLAMEFERRTGVALNSDLQPRVERLDAGGMSGGHVSTQLWRTNLVPLLLDRARGLHANAEVARQLAQAKSLARDYRHLTGKPLGITGEVAEFAAAQLLGLTLAKAREAGYDAIRHVGEREVKVQIKGRCIGPASSPGQPLGSIRLAHPWDTVMLVLLDEALEPISIYEAERPAIEAALLKPGSRARNERGSLAVSKFKSIGQQIWARPAP